MTDFTPVETKNLDGYGNDTLEWQRAYDALANPKPSTQMTYILSTAGADGKPHAAAIGAIWHDDGLWFISGPGTRKSRNLAENPFACVSVGLKGIDLILEGKVERITDPAVIAEIARMYRELGWPAEPDASGEGVTAPFNAPAAGPPPWHVHRFQIDTMYGTATEDPQGTTRWRFDAGKA
jgi:hypothetical protein